MNESQLTQRISDLQRQVEIEMQCKNKAYLFIIANGLLEQFRAFELNYRGNAFQDCRKLIIKTWGARVASEL